MTVSAVPGQQPTVPLSEAFKQLSRQQRRRIVSALKQANPRNSKESTSPDEVNGIGLYHNNLSRLAQAGITGWDPEFDIRPRSRFDEIAPLISPRTDHQDELPEAWP